MEFSTFGRTGWRVCRLSLGTVELGMPYGFYFSGEPPCPTRRAAIDLILRALDAGINLLDTAPSYGESESILGEAVAQWKGEVLIASKAPTDGRTLEVSVDQTLRRLRRDTIDLLQLHNCTTADLDRGDVLEAGDRLRDKGKIRHVGVTIYEIEEGLRALQFPQIVSIQLPFNLLDTRMMPVLADASKVGTAILARSVFLKGVLTDRRSRLPRNLAELEKASDCIAASAEKIGLSVAEAALRFCVSQPLIHSSLVGVRSREELATATSALRPIAQTQSPGDTARLVAAVPVGSESLLDPRTWDLKHEAERS